jgi:hypothetical protein
MTRAMFKRATIVVALSLLHVACSTAPMLPNRYAQCMDLGTLRLAATNSNDAERRMRAQVEILGGDLLLFNARGHAESSRGVPSALTQRRNVLAAVPVESINGRQPELEALTASVAAAQETQVELWYYGAALRCKAAAASG